MAYTLEKKILSEFIQMYKDLPCLWNTCHAFYTNKLARNRALDVLLEQYKKFDSSADKYKMKKKIENMRTTYKRERNKVMKSQLNGDELYEPSLWYYSEMKFLDELNDLNTTENGNRTTEVANNDGDDEDEPSESPPAKKPKPASIFLTESENEYIETMNNSPRNKTKKTNVYLSDDNDYQEEASYSIKNEPSDLYVGTSSESDLFGRTIAAQLTELRPKQRFIAEKLISDVIFFGRLDKLKTGTSLNLNNDCL